MLKYDYQPGPKGTLIFIHGAGGNRTKWRNQMASLPEGFGGLALDLEGHGESEGEAPTEVKAYAAGAVECVRNISPPRPFVWVGHSLGGAIVMTVALIYPDMADYQILIGTGARLKVVPENLEKLRNGIVDPAAKRLAYSPFTSDDLINAEIAADMKNDPRIAYHAMLACDQFDIIDQLSSISIPSLLIVGKDDISTPPKYSEFLLDKLPQASLNIIEKAGHIIMLEQPAAVNEHIDRFLKEKVGS